jgi:hypothetical protein
MDQDPSNSPTGHQPFLGKAADREDGDSGSEGCHGMELVTLKYKVTVDFVGNNRDMVSFCNA